jgi:hypothetical protein
MTPNKLILVIALGATSTACSERDRGICLASHIEHFPQFVTYPYMGVMKNGQWILFPQHHPAHDEEICDKWEKP